MPFLIYKCSQGTDGTDYKRTREVKIAGNSGPIVIHVNKQNSQRKSPFAWHMTEKNLLTNLNSPPQNHAIVIDMKPNVKNNVSLYQLKDVWGFSYDSWTPLLIRLETLFVDEKNENPVTFKQLFNDQPTVREHIHEFLYLQGGVNGGTWNWGMVGRVNGALLWPDALKYFISELTI